MKLAAIILAALMMLPGPLLAETLPKILKAMSEDAPDATDHKFTGRYEGSFIVGQTVKAFDELTLPDGAAVGKKFSSTITVSGRVTRTMYLTPEGRSSLEVFTNYRDKLTEKGFVPVFECAKEACGESFKALKYKWSNKATMLVSDKADDPRKFLSQAMLDRVIDPRYVLMRWARRTPRFTLPCSPGKTTAAALATVPRRSVTGSACWSRSSSPMCWKRKW